ncbi:MAG: glucose-6-phosphate dehydrogenase assembly protein OpcA [Nocardioides sp.]|uniref:glucose-6-phosphate dehydrogenase assembly protein OpcA n=1 Tax=Nocardioides sp. TaxID=35761 RepID=UPI0039E2B75B
MNQSTQPAQAAQAGRSVQLAPTELPDTNAAAIAAEFIRARREAGSPAMGMVMTLVVVTDDQHAEEAMGIAHEAAQEHPARILGVVIGARRGHGRVHAQIGIGVGHGGESALIRLTGEVTAHPESVVLPLLLPDSPVVAWWPVKAPADPAGDPIGRLAQRRITDAASIAAAGGKKLVARCAAYAPGNTDLAWTRLTPWRALLAAAFDNPPGRPTGAVVAAERGNPSADLLAAWLRDRLKVTVTQEVTDGPGVTTVTVGTSGGDVRITRPDGRLARYSIPGGPERPIALKRRGVPELLNEELRRLDEDEVYAATARALVRAADGQATTGAKTKTGAKTGAAKTKKGKK